MGEGEIVGSDNIFMSDRVVYRLFAWIGFFRLLAVKHTRRRHHKR